MIVSRQSVRIIGVIDAISTDFAILNNSNFLSDETLLRATCGQIARHLLDQQKTRTLVAKRAEQSQGVSTPF